jgi:hypothetical protein
MKYIVARCFSLSAKQQATLPVTDVQTFPSGKAYVINSILLIKLLFVGFA